MLRLHALKQRDREVTQPHISESAMAVTEFNPTGFIEKKIYSSCYTSAATKN
jgi:hypothetical protein